MDLDRFADDSPEDKAPEDARVCIVATQTDTFDRCRDGIYPSPKSYDRTRADFEYMAFYRTAPVSGITHYATVKNRTEQTRGEPGPMNEKDWQKLIDPFSSERVVVVFELGELIPINNPVKNDINGVRGAWYCTINDIRDSATLSELETVASTSS